MKGRTRGGGVIPAMMAKHSAGRGSLAWKMSDTSSAPEFLSVIAPVRSLVRLGGWRVG